MSREEQLNKLLKLEQDLTHMFDSDLRVAMALLEEIRKLNQNKDMVQRYIPTQEELEKENRRFTLDNIKIEYWKKHGRNSK